MKRGQTLSPRTQLKKYQSMRNFSHTKEPSGLEPTKAASKSQRVKIGSSILDKVKRYRFVIQKHAASHLHYDFRLESQGVLKSWAVPKGPATDPSVKRLAMRVEDHPLNYAGFEGTIPQGEYGGGAVMVWDQGTYINLTHHNGERLTLPAGIARGHIDFWLEGKKLKGGWSLFRISENPKEWLLKKMTDAAASKTDITARRPLSVLTRRSIEQIGRDQKSKVWHSNR